MKRLFLLDGMALIYRAHFALIHNPIRNSKGVNTSALFGFVNTLLSILEKEAPTHLGVAFDTSAPTPRHTLFPAYKGQRDAMPEEISAAIPHVKAICRAFALPVLELDGYEADDIIGTLVKRASGEGFESFMVTPDKDFAQLIDERTKMWKPGRKGSDHEVIGLAELPGIWGVSEPSEIIDLLGLMGDASDNIPGVPGIGAKTAAKLISQFGGIDKLLANTDGLTPKLRQVLTEFADQARLSKELATIIIDVPIHVEWSDLELGGRHDEEIGRIFDDMEFRTLRKRVFGERVGAATASVETSAIEVVEEPPATLRTLAEVKHEYRIADTAETAAMLFKELSGGPFSFVVQTSSQNRFEAEILGIAFSREGGRAWYLPDAETHRAALGKLFSSASEKIGHNLKFDLSVLAAHQYQVDGPFFDVMLVDAIVMPERRHSIDRLAESLLDYAMIKPAEMAQASAAADQDDLFQAAARAAGAKNLDLRTLPLATLAEIAAETADVTWRLACVLRPQLEESGQADIYRTIEAPLLPALTRMELQGIAIDPAAISVIGNGLQEKIGKLEATIQEMAGAPFNLASPKQLGEVLFERLGLADKAKKTKTGQYRTDEQTLSSLDGKHPIIALILEWREATKLKGTYLDALPQHVNPKTGRIHAQFHQLLAVTGRLACSDPNLQNIPVRSDAGRRIRGAFVARPGRGTASGTPNFQILSCDYSQIELRVMAALAGDETMIAAFREGIDIHTTTASKVFQVAMGEVTSEMRRTSKMVNFGIIYGISAFGLSQRLGIPRGEAVSIIKAYFTQYPAIQRYMTEVVDTARELGYAETLSGRRRNFPDLRSGSAGIRANAERAAINMPIQGTAADMIKLAMVKIDAIIREGNFRSRMILQVHDELLFDLAVSEENVLVPKILEAMRTSLPLPSGVPIVVEHGIAADWLGAH